MQFSQHALEKCALYGSTPSLCVMQPGTGVRVLDRPWVAVLTPDDTRVITVYPTDQRTVQARRAGGRWLFLNR